MFVDGRSVPISPFGTNTGEARVSGHGGRIVIDAGRGEDDIQVSNLGCGRYNVRVNGKDHTFSREEMSQLHIKGGKGSDRITIGPGVDIPVTVDGGKGNDSIINYSNGTNISGGKGDDAIINRGNGANISGGKGRDSIDSVGNGNRIHGNKHDDVINSIGFGNHIEGGRGDDQINSLGSGNHIEGNRGRDRIQSFGHGNNIEGNRGADDIFSYGYGNRTDGGRGPDNVINQQPYGGCLHPGGWNHVGVPTASNPFLEGFVNGYRAGHFVGSLVSGNWGGGGYCGANAWSLDLSQRLLAHSVVTGAW